MTCYCNNWPVTVQRCGLLLFMPWLAEWDNLYVINKKGGKSFYPKRFLKKLYPTRDVVSVYRPIVNACCIRWKLGYSSRSLVQLCAKFSLLTMSNLYNFLISSFELVSNKLHRSEDTQLFIEEDTLCGRTRLLFPKRKYWTD